MSSLPVPVSLLLQLGYWIVEDLVNRTSEHYPRGGIKYLVCYMNILSSLESDVRLLGSRSRMAPRSKDTSHSGSSRASWCGCRKPDVCGEVSISLQYGAVCNGYLMRHVKLYKQSPVLRKYACGTSEFFHLNEVIDGL